MDFPFVMVYANVQECLPPRFLLNFESNISESENLLKSITIGEFDQGSFDITVEPRYKDHHKDFIKVVAIARWSL